MEADQAPALLESSFSSQFNSDNKNTANNGGGDNFMVEDLFDFSNHDGIITDGTFGSDVAAGNSTECSTVTAVDSSCNSSSFSGCEPNFVQADIGCRNFSDGHFSGDIGVPYDDLAHLEWLSNFVEESFSSEDLEKLQLISGMKARTDEASETRGVQPEQNRNTPVFYNPEVSVPGKARSKRSRAPPCSWTSRLRVLSPAESQVAVPTPESVNTVKKPGKGMTQRKKDSGDGSSGDGRKCLHCATDKTPQWRTGPMGPKTLCNACGVRYKSGRLVPEYRPAASPTFVLTKHSNSHRKVMELRRQKDMMRAQQLQQHQQHQFLQQQGMMFDVSNGEDCLIPQHVGPEYRQLI